MIVPLNTEENQKVNVWFPDESFMSVQWWMGKIQSDQRSIEKEGGTSTKTPLFFCTKYY